MLTFFVYLAGFSILGYALLMLLGMVIGEAAWLVGGLLIVGTVAALLACVLEKLYKIEQRLERMEEKADTPAEKE